MSSDVGYDTVAQALAAGGSTVLAAEAHGCLVGALCARRVYLPAEWLEELLPEAPEQASSPALATGPLQALFERSRAELEARDMEFEPLMPPEEAGLAELVEFLRVGVQLIYDELTDLRASQTTSTARH